MNVNKPHGVIFYSINCGCTQIWNDFYFFIKEMGLADWLITSKNQKEKKTLPCFEHKPLIKILKLSTRPKYILHGLFIKNMGLKVNLLRTISRSMGTMGTT
jgi:hypothetical protein